MSDGLFSGLVLREPLTPGFAANHTPLLAPNYTEAGGGKAPQEAGEARASGERERERERMGESLTTREPSDKQNQLLETRNIRNVVCQFYFFQSTD